jgi:20S proteasome subunit alpha 5
MIQVATGEGVILGVEKRVTSTLLETSSVEKIVEIDRHIGCAMSGLQADARSMVEHARVESQNHAFNYNEPLRVESCTQAICDLALRFGEGAEGEESIMSRPFGVALLIAGYDEDGPSLYVIYSHSLEDSTREVDLTIIQVPRRALRHILPLRRKGHRLRI